VTDDEALCLDSMISQNVAQFLNHRCEDANLLDMFVMIETHNHITTMYMSTLKHSSSLICSNSSSDLHNCCLIT